MSVKKMLLSGIGVMLLLSGVIAAMIQPNRLRNLDNRPETSQAQLDTRNQAAKKAELVKAVSSNGESANVLNQQELQRALEQLRGLSQAKNLDEFIKKADELEQIWGLGGGDNYGRLVINTASILANEFDDKNGFGLSQKYAVAALAQADSLSLDIEYQLLGAIERDLTPLGDTPEAQRQWAEERAMKAKFYLHAWRRLEKEINRNFDFDAPKYLNVSPPKETGLPAGVVPEAIKDPKLRAKYEADIKLNAKRIREYSLQLRLQQLDKKLPQRAERYLVNAYSRPPYNLAELKSFLKDYGFMPQVEERLSSTVLKNTTEEQ
ncbi:MAG TPA: hypothetical protein VM911_04835 [Pyrinomonadaceae bacterium]|jgi:hypothetical protein|nr:hypothetical protein [Pyrinomonadaceae bacterium]